MPEEQTGWIKVVSSQEQERQESEIDLSVKDGKLNRTGRRQARSLGNSRQIAGSTPASPILQLSGAPILFTVSRQA